MHGRLADRRGLFQLEHLSPGHSRRRTMATVRCDHQADWPLSVADALRESRWLAAYALDCLAGSEHPGVGTHARAAVVQLDGAISAASHDGHDTC